VFFLADFTFFLVFFFGDTLDFDLLFDGDFLEIFLGDFELIFFFFFDDDFFGDFEDFFFFFGVDDEDSFCLFRGGDFSQSMALCSEVLRLRDCDWVNALLCLICVSYMA